MKSRKQKPQQINTGSMADIAFLLLIFFLVSTTILQEKGLMLRLPPEPEEQLLTKIRERNLFKIRINSSNHYLIEDEITSDLNGLQERVIAFVMNHGEDPNLSESPQKAIISLKTSRGTDYKYFIDALDIVKEAYYEIYGTRVGLTAMEYRNLNPDQPSENQLYMKGREGIPMNISIAEPDDNSN